MTGTFQNTRLCDMPLIATPRSVVAYLKEMAGDNNGLMNQIYGQRWGLSRCVQVENDGQNLSFTFCVSYFKKRTVRTPQLCAEKPVHVLLSGIGRHGHDWRQPYQH